LEVGRIEDDRFVATSERDEDRLEVVDLGGRLDAVDGEAGDAEWISTEDVSAQALPAGRRAERVGACLEGIGRPSEASEPGVGSGRSGQSSPAIGGG